MTEPSSGAVQDLCPEKRQLFRMCTHLSMLQRYSDIISEPQKLVMLSLFGQLLCRAVLLLNGYPHCVLPWTGGCTVMVGLFPLSVK